MISEDKYPLGWVKEFIASVKPYVHLRREDRLVILMPNQAYKLNSSAIDILDHVLNGGDVEVLLERKIGSERARRDTYHFFCDFKALVSGCFGDGQGRKAVSHVRFEAPFSTLPILSEMALTYSCNLACRFCYAGCNCRSKDEKSSEITTTQAKRILELIRNEADVPSVSFTGGEPTLRDDLPDLIAHARKLGMRVNLITNGTRITCEYALLLAGDGLNSAQVSIEGSSPDVHEGLTRTRGSFEKTLRGIRALVEAGIYTQTNTTLNSANAHDAVGIVDLVADLGMKRFAMNMLTPSGSALADRSLFISYLEIGDVVLRVKERAQKRGVEFLWYSPTPYCLFNPVAERLGNKSCAACDGLLSIDPEGEVLPCSSFDYGVGNVLNIDFLDIWQSAQAAFWRNKKYAPEQCDGCSSFDVCAGACPLYWDACGTAELNTAFRKVAS